MGVTIDVSSDDHRTCVELVDFSFFQVEAGGYIMKHNGPLFFYCSPLSGLSALCKLADFPLPGSRAQRFSSINQPK